MRVGSTNTEDHQQCRERPVFQFMSLSVTIADFPINENSLSENPATPATWFQYHLQPALRRFSCSDGLYAVQNPPCNL